MLFVYSIPTTGYYPDECWFEDFFVESDKFLSKEEFLEILEKQKTKDEEDFSNHPENYFGIFPVSVEAFDLVKKCVEFPRLYSGMIQTNVFMDHPRYGKQSFSVKRIDQKILR